MSEKLQSGRGLVERLRRGFDEVTGRFACGRVYEHNGEEIVLEKTDQESCLSLQLTVPRHERMNIVSKDTVERVHRKPAVELMRVRGAVTQTCRVNLGYTPGSTFFRTGNSVEVDLDSDRIYLLKSHTEQPVLRIKTALKILRRGVGIVEDKEVSLMDSSLVDRNGRVFKIRKT